MTWVLFMAYFLTFHQAEVVMTAIKNEEHSIMRLERLPKALVDYSKVHHVGGGPYKGILINKQATGKGDHSDTYYTFRDIDLFCCKPNQD